MYDTVLICLILNLNNSRFTETVHLNITLKQMLKYYIFAKCTKINYTIINTYLITTNYTI